MPISPRVKWYTRKPPTLEIKILKAIAREGQLSKRMSKDLTGSHYPDVSDAIEKLWRRRKLILASDEITNQRDKRFFKLSTRGLEVFIDENPTPEEFWKAILWFCELSNSKIDWPQFNTLCSRFQYNYLGYTPRHGYFFQFNFLDKLFEKWLNDNDKVYDPTRDNTVRTTTVSQRVLECLGMNRLITFDQLWQYIEEQRHIFEKRTLEEARSQTPHTDFVGKSSDRITSKEKIKRALDYCTLNQSYSKPYHGSRPDIRYTFDNKIAEYIDLMQHLLVVYTHDKNGIMRYELSLFGIALLLSLTRHHYLNPEKLFYNTLKFQEYYKKLALCYKDKLPLIFGKWNTLSKSMSDEDIPTATLGLLFYEKDRNARIQSSVLVGGFREYYENIETLARHTYIKLKEIYESAESILQDEENLIHFDHTELLYRKVEEIRDSLRLRDLERFMESLWDDTGLKKDSDRIFQQALFDMETAFAEEMTFLFYLFLSDQKRNLVQYGRTYSTYFPASFKQVDGRRTVPSRELLDLLKNEKDIRRSFAQWIKDSVECQGEVHGLMSLLANESINK